MISRKVLFSAIAFVVASTVTVGAADLTYTESGTINEAISIPEGQVFEISVAEGTTVTNTGAITGAGGLKLTGGGTLALDAENTFSGGLEINGGFVNVLCDGCLGTGNIRLTSTTYPHGINFLAPGAVFANDITIEREGGNLKQSSGATDMGRLHLYFGATTTLDGNVLADVGSGKFGFGGKMNDTQSIITFNGDFTLNGNGNRAFITYANFVFNGPFYCANDIYVGDRASCYGNVYLNHPDNVFGTRNKNMYSYAPVMYLGAENALGTNAIYYARYSYNSAERNQLYLQGANQRFRGVKSYYPFQNSSTTDCTGDGLRISATRASTLVFTGIDNKEDRCGAKFSGPLSFVFDADNPAMTLVLSNRVHEMSGSLIVSNGTVRTKGDTSFANASAVEVASGAALDIQTPLAGALASCIRIKVDGTFTYAEGGTNPFHRPAIELGANAAVYFGSGTLVEARELIVSGLNGNEPLADGIYTSAEVPQLKDGATIKVRRAAWPETLAEPIYTVTTSADMSNLDDMTVTVTSGGVTETKAFSEIAGPTVGTLRKLGEGQLMSSSKLAAFTGTILVEEGVFAVNDRLQTGPEVYGVGNTATIWVKDGASFSVSGTKNTCGQGNLKLYNTFHFSGSGYQSRGAFIAKLDVQQAYLFKGKWILEGDTMVSAENSFRWDWSGMKEFELDMNYHTLTCLRRSSKWTLYVSGIKSVERMGRIFFKGTGLHIESSHGWQAKGMPEIHFADDPDGNAAWIAYYNSHIKVKDLPLFIDGPNGVDFVSNGSDKEASWFVRGNLGNNCYQGPITINVPLQIRSDVTRRGVSLEGPLSGAGLLTAKNGVLQLSGDNKAFSGPVAVTSEDVGQKSGARYMAELIVMKPESLTPAAAFVTVTNAPVTLWNAGDYRLPGFEIMTPADTNLTFSGGGNGKIASLAKTGAGTLEFTSPLAVTGALEVAEGVLDWAGKPLEVDTLFAGGGTLNGDCKVCGTLALSPRAVSDAGKVLTMTIQGALMLSPEIKVDFSRAAVDSALKGEQVLLTATEGINGALPADVSTDKPRWRLSVEGNRIIARRFTGMVLLIK